MELRAKAGRIPYGRGSSAGPYILYSRRGRLQNDCYPKVVAALGSLPDDTLLDGEIVVVDGSGCPSFTLLQNYNPTLDANRDRMRPTSKAGDSLPRFGIELSYVDLDLVVTSLPVEPDTRATLSDLYRSQAVETDESIEEAGNWVVNKLWDPTRQLETADLTRR